jgi:hypothetical protein
VSEHWAATTFAGLTVYPDIDFPDVIESNRNVGFNPFTQTFQAPGFGELNGAKLNQVSCAALAGLPNAQ